MTDDSVSRRDVLKGVAAGVAATGFAGQASASEDVVGHVVKFRPGRSADVARRRASRVRHELDFGHLGTAIAGEFPEAALEGLRNNPNVEYVEEDRVKYRAYAQTLPWGIDRVDADVLHANGETGSGADVAIIDTGIDDDHPDLQANVGTGRAFGDATCGSVNSCFPYAGPNDNACNFEWSDDNDHGTHCAGIADAIDDTEDVVGVSTEATLHAAKVLDGCGSGTLSDVAAGIQWVADQGYDVGSLSLGASSGDQTLQDACQYAYDSGVLLVAAAGNSGPCSDCVGYPAAYDTVIAVSSTDSDDTLSDFSSTGPEVELAAPGGSILSTVPPESSSDGTDTFSGTSMACPHVSGAGGQLMANGYTNTEARSRLQNTAEDIGLASNEQGHGLLDAENAVLDSSTNTAPSCSIVNPSDGATVSGTVTVQVDASDGEDDDTTLTVEVSIDGGTYQTATYDSTSGYYEYDWDTTGASDGDHTIDARATDSAGATTNASQVTVTVDNTTDTSVAVSTDAASNVTDSSATLNGTLDDLAGASSADVYFEYRESGASTWTATSAQTLSSTGSFSQDVSGLASGTDYEYRAVADASDGDSDTGTAVTFTTDSGTGDTAPAIDSYAVTEAGSPNPHAEITADWAVSDADGDLSSVEVAVYDSSGSLVDSSTTNVSGSSASGSDQFKIKHADGQTFDVTLTVTDAAGNSASGTQTVTE